MRRLRLEQYCEVRHFLVVRLLVRAGGSRGCPVPPAGAEVRDHRGRAPLRHLVPRLGAQPHSLTVIGDRVRAFDLTEFSEPHGGSDEVLRIVIQQVVGR